MEADGNPGMQNFKDFPFKMQEKLCVLTLVTDEQNKNNVFRRGRNNDTTIARSLNAHS